MTSPPAFEPIHSPPPERGQPLWPLLLAGVLIIVAAGVAVWALLGRGEPPTAEATPSPRATVGLTPMPTATPDLPTELPATPASTDGGPTPTPTAPTATAPTSPGPTTTPIAGATPPSEIAEAIDRVVGQVPQLRQLEPLSEVPYEFVSREQFEADLVDLFEEEVEPEQLAAEERLFKRLGLLEPDIDLRESLLDLYGSQVAAFYRPDTKRFYIIGEGLTVGPLDQMIVAHEYTHALQDQHFDLEGRRITDPSQGDAALAQLAAIEGDASLLMLQWGFANLSERELAGLDESLNPADQELLESMPQVLRRQLEFPYNEGFFFSVAVWSEGGWSAINETITDPPTTTEQILHPDKYLAGEPAVEVEIADLSADLGEGWQRSYEQTMGELNAQIWVAAGEEPASQIPGLPARQPHAEAAEGWGGDRLAMYESPDGGWAIAWEIAWDSQEDADEFLARAEELQDTLDGVSFIDASAESERVIILLAHDASTLDDLARTVGFIRSVALRHQIDR